MFNTAARDLALLHELPALLNTLPAFGEALGFHFYSFSYSSPTHEVYASNLLSGGRWLIQAALEAKPHHDHQYSCPPVLWTDKALPGRPHLWDVAQELGMRHGLIQPIYDGELQSSLTFLRPHVSLSTQELYQKAAQIMLLGDHLHRAAVCSAAVGGGHAPSAPSHTVQGPAAGSRSSAAGTPGTRRA
ncbi:autoinducer binding domain-containing protein [Pseudomonas sp. JV551A1]